MNGLLNQMRREGARAQSVLALPRRAVVSAYDPNAYAAKVLLQPEAFETGFLPIACPWVGSGWGMFCPPTPGDEVDVHFQEGGKNAAYVMLRFYGANALPVAVNSGEFWLVHQTGSLVKLTNDGKLTINGNVEIDLTGPTINITAATAVNVTAPEINLGSTSETLRKLVNDQMVELYNTHTHSGIQGGDESTGVPNEQMTNSELTSVTSAG